MATAEYISDAFARDCAAQINATASFLLRKNLQAFNNYYRKHQHSEASNSRPQRQEKPVLGQRGAADNVG